MTQSKEAQTKTSTNNYKFKSNANLPKQTIPIQKAMNQQFLYSPKSMFFLESYSSPNTKK